MSGVVVTAAVPPVSPVVRAVQAWFAPVDLLTGLPVPFDPVLSGRFAAGAPPAGWFSAGPVVGFTRKNATAMTEVRSGAPALPKTLAKHTVDATVAWSFTAWSKLALLLSCGARQMNLLAEAGGAVPNGSGGSAVAAVALLPGSTATVLQVAAGSMITAGDLLVVDEDYAGQTGAVGAGVAGAVVSSGAAIGNDANYVRRVSVNVARVQSVQAGAVALAQPLVAGTPTATMKAARLSGFVDREGDAFQRQWSALFAMDGVQGDRVLLHYPRLQANGGTTESAAAVAAGLERWRLDASFTALPVMDSNDGAEVLCFRSYLPAPMRTV